MTSYTDGFLCCPDDQDDAEMSGVLVLVGEGPQAVVVPPVVSVHKGRKLMLLHISSSMDQALCVETVSNALIHQLS